MTAPILDLNVPPHLSWAKPMGGLLARHLLFSAPIPDRILAHF